MKKVAFISSLSGLGGTEKSLISMLQSLPSNLFEVDLLLFGKEGPLTKQVPSWINIQRIHETNGREYVRTALKQGRVFKAGFGVWRSLQLKVHWMCYKTDTMFQYKKALHLYQKPDEQYDVAISWFVPNAIETVYTIEAVCAKKKLLWIHMDVSMDKMPPDAESVFKKYDRIFCVSKSCKEAFDHMYPICREKSAVYYNIIDVHNIMEASAENVDLIFDNQFVIVTCGRIVSEKRPFLAIKIVNQLIQDGYKDFVWLFIGDGVLYEPMKQEIHKNRLEDYIIMLGNLINPYAYMGKSDIYVQMSLHESFCLTLAESQILNIPSVTTGFPSAYEIVRDGKTGYIVTGGWKELYKRIKYLIDNEEVRIQMKKNLSTYPMETIGTTDKFLQYVNSEV